MKLVNLIKDAIVQAESELSERELKDHKKIRTSTIDVLKWMQCRKVGFLVHKPNYIGEEYLPLELIDYLESEYCQGNQILIPYGWEVDCSKWKSQGNQNFWSICQTSLLEGKPMKKSSSNPGLGSPNTWERGRD